MPRHNAEFAVPAAQEGSVFVLYVGHLPDVLSQHFERTIGNNNCVSFEGLFLQIPASGIRPHYAKVRVRVHRYVDGTLAVFHGPRKLAEYDQQGQLKELVIHLRQTA